MRDHLIQCLENNQFTMFPCCKYPSNVCMSSERVLEVELHCECRMPELSESYFGFPTETCQLTPIRSVTHAFDITHTLTRIHNSFTRIHPNLAARLKNQ